MQTQDTFYQVMRRHGVTRRSFLKFCSLTATSLGLSSSMIPQIAYALENKPRTPVIWLHGLECTCCTESFIRSAHPLAKDAILSLISLDYDDTIMAAAGQQAEQALADVMREYKGNYIVAVEGNAPLNEDGMFWFPDNPNDYSASNLLLPRGAIINGRFDEIHPVDLTAPDEIQEFVTHSWYTYGNGNNDKGLHPWDGLTEPQLVMGEHYKGTKTFIEQVDESAKYSWIKSPRWKGHAMEVGPLARYLIGYHQNKPEFKEPVDQLLSVLKLPKEALFSTLGRTAARALESVWAGNTLQYFFDRLMRNLKSGDTATANVTLWEPDTWPTSAKGVGFSEAPRGALGHWIKIENQKIDSYQCVVPTTWNAGPRDDKGQIGAYEAALMGTKLAVPDQPLEILRTLHSFDPCLACSTHVIDNHGGELVRVQVR
ncbi:hydrogenase small subunit [Salmonella enterica]|nr:hydrogenase small subunit [Salmonella enterica]